LWHKSLPQPCSLAPPILCNLLIFLSGGLNVARASSVKAYCHLGKWAYRLTANATSSKTFFIPHQKHHRQTRFVHQLSRHKQGGSVEALGNHLKTNGCAKRWRPSEYRIPLRPFYVSIAQSKNLKCWTAVPFVKDA